ncbi:MAG: precorrin-2 C(20)-methyltransferase [Thermodesulfobacteriota bacterium]
MSDANIGTLYGIGVGPGDPDLITVKGAAMLGRCRHVFAPRAPHESESLAYRIAAKHIRSDAQIHRITFPMTSDRSELQARWRESAGLIAEVLQTGADACYLTLGDTLLYSTYVYLLRELTALCPEAHVVTIPGISSFSAAAARVGFPVGEGKNPVVVVPAAEDLDDVTRGLAMGGTVVLMKVGSRLQSILDLLEATGHIDRAAFVARVGMPGEYVQTDVRSLKGRDDRTGHLSTILIDASR